MSGQQEKNGVHDIGMSEGKNAFYESEARQAKNGHTS